ncbi:MAG: EthD family reductase [Candidatus Limnocylindria bacterium]
MVARLIALFNQPDDREAFDAHYRDTHTPIVRRYPNLRGIRLTRTDGVAGRPAAFYLMAEMAFDSRADLEAALVSEAGIESGRDLRSFAQAGVTLLVADDEAGTDA